MGDFGFLRFAWTSQQQQAFLTRGIPPKTITDLPPQTCIMPLYYYARDLECHFNGPAVTQAHFCRVNSQSVSRLFIWDLWGRDGVDHSTPLTVFPSEDVRPTQNQRDLYANNMHNDYNKQRSVRAPLVTHFFSTGLYASEYVVGSQGPLAYDGNDWSEIWHLLHRFACSNLVEHPNGYVRHAALYRHPLLHFHQCLVKEHDLAVGVATSYSLVSSDCCTSELYDTVRVIAALGWPSVHYISILEVGI